MRGQHLVEHAREGLNPLSQIARTLLGYTGPPRFAGVNLSGPDPTSSWGIAYQIASGEYNFPGLRPRRGDRVIDIGANIGIFSLWAAKLGASVTAYEPAPATFEHLKINIRKRESIEGVWAAVVGSASDPPTVPLYLHDERSTRNTLIGREIGTGGPLERRIDVPAVTIGEALEQECDLLKIDCEGGEFDILAHAEDADLQRAKRMVLEFHRSVGTPETLLDRLRDAGFEAEVLAGGDPADSFGVIGAQR